MRSLPPARNQLRIRYRCRLVATGSPSCRRHVQVENLHPQFTFPLPTLLCGDKIPSCLLSNQQVENLLPQFKFPTPPLFVATGGHRVEGMCKLKTCTHGLKTCTHGLKMCTHENVHPRKASNAALFGPILPEHARHTAAGQCTAARFGDGTKAAGVSES